SRQWPAPPSWQRRSVRTSTWPRTRAGPIRADLGAASRSRLAESTAIAAIGWQRILLRPARVSAGRMRLCDFVEAISARLWSAVLRSLVSLTEGVRPESSSENHRRYRG